MAAQLVTHQFTVQDYHRMAEAGGEHSEPQPDLALLQPRPETKRALVCPPCAAPAAEARSVRSAETVDL